MGVMQRLADQRSNLTIAALCGTLTVVRSIPMMSMATFMCSPGLAADTDFII